MTPVSAHRRLVDEDESRRANGPDWDRYADEYQATHGAFLGDVGFVWGPEGLTEAEAGLLGPLAGRDVLEVGSGAGQCSRWVRSQGGRAVGLCGLQARGDGAHQGVGRRVPRQGHPRLRHSAGRNRVGDAQVGLSG